jgi:hypothetical protein
VKRAAELHKNQAGVVLRNPCLIFTKELHKSEYFSTELQMRLGDVHDKLTMFSFQCLLDQLVIALPDCQISGFLILSLHLCPLSQGPKTIPIPNPETWKAPDQTLALFGSMG